MTFKTFVLKISIKKSESLNLCGKLVDLGRFASDFFQVQAINLFS